MNLYSVQLEIQCIIFYKEQGFCLFLVNTPAKCCSEDALRPTRQQQDSSPFLMFLIALLAESWLKVLTPASTQSKTEAKSFRDETVKKRSGEQYLIPYSATLAVRVGRKASHCWASTIDRTISGYSHKHFKEAKKHWGCSCSCEFLYWLAAPPGGLPRPHFCNRKILYLDVWGWYRPLLAKHKMHFFWQSLVGLFWKNK